MSNNWIAAAALVLLLAGPQFGQAAEPTAKTSLPFSSAVEHNGLVILSGMVAFRPGTTQLIAGSREEEFHQVIRNVAAVLGERGLTLSDVVKCTVLLADIADWPAFNDVYVRYFKPPYPARTAAGVSALPLGARVEVECWAARRSAK